MKREPLSKRSRGPENEWWEIVFLILLHKLTWRSLIWSSKRSATIRLLLQWHLQGRLWSSYRRRRSSDSSSLWDRPQSYGRGNFEIECEAQISRKRTNWEKTNRRIKSRTISKRFQERAPSSALSSASDFTGEGVFSTLSVGSEPKGVVRSFLSWFFISKHRRSQCEYFPEGNEKEVPAVRLRLATKAQTWSQAPTLSWVT